MEYTQHGMHSRMVPKMFTYLLMCYCRSALAESQAAYCSCTTAAVYKVIFFFTQLGI